MRLSTSDSIWACFSSYNHPPLCSHLLVKLLHGKCKFCYCSGVLTDFTDIQCAVHRRIWHPTPVLLPGKSHGPRSLISYSPWGRKESDTTERLTHKHSQVTMVFCWISVVFPGHKLRLTIFMLVNFLIPFWHTSHREIITLVVSRHANMHVHLWEDTVHQETTLTIHSAIPSVGSTHQTHGTQDPNQSIRRSQAKAPLKESSLLARCLAQWFYVTEFNFPRSVNAGGVGHTQTPLLS